MIRDFRENRFDRSYFGFVVEYYKGGGGYVPPPQPSPMEEAEAQLHVRREEARMQAEREAAEEARREQLRQTRIATNTSRLEQSRTEAMSELARMLARRGVSGPDADMISEEYGNRVRRAASSFNPDSETFIDPFGPDIGAQAFDTVRQAKRGQLTNQMRQFAGSGFENDAFADTADDAYIDAILGEQQKEAQDAIERAYARGQINDGGKSFAVQEVGKQGKRGRVTANTLGLGVLNNYRTNLRNSANQLRDRVNNFDFGDDLDLTREQTNIEGMKRRFSDQMEGDILNALGDQQFFDAATILGKAGTRSGVSNSPVASTSGVGSTAANQNLLSVFGDRTGENTNEDTKTNQVF